MDISILTNERDIAERRRDNAAQRIQQLRGLRDPAQQNVSANAQQSSNIGVNAAGIGNNASGGRGRRNPSRHVHFQDSPQNNPQPTSARIKAKKPIMGGLAEWNCGKEAWTGGKPNHLWTGLENPS